MHRLLWLSLFLTVQLVNAGSQAATADSSLADKVASQLRRALPGYEVTVVDRLTIKAGKSPDPAQRIQVNLDRVANYCVRAPDRCDAMVSDFVSKTAGVMKARELTPAITMLQAVVRPATYVAQLTKVVGGKGDELISVPFAGDLVMLCYFDAPTAMRPALKSDLAKIGLSRELAIDTCVNNTRARLPRLPTTPPRPETSRSGAIGYLKGDAYESSYLLLHEEWAPLAEKLGGHLLVAVPDVDSVLFSGDVGTTSRDALSTLAKQAYGGAQRPISTNVFRWTPVGWEVAIP